MPKTTQIECHCCGSISVGENAPYQFLRRVCPKPGSCTAAIISNYVSAQSADGPRDTPARLTLLTEASR